ncbi:putative DnaJ domain-containing protein [Lupinus albus]|uniref:Putative DnaJ domain-containing protein n=1 Tax=Lupinus albus TaxID=3870 RepID=A0A6A4QJ78_LUPAL|nr:putative DnaJ domain-containing protein [Lupinus albus]
MEGGGSRAEAERWLYTANKLLSAHDFHGARSFAVRARESDPTFDASELLLTVIDTVLAGEIRINDHHCDWYGILQILRYTTNIDHIAAQYRRLALLLDPHRNPFAFSGHAFSLVHDAWSVLSNPVKKAMYDNDLRLLTSQPPPPQPPQPPPPPTQPQPQQKKNPRSKILSTEPAPNTQTGTEPNESTRTESEEASFWTSCPYCYVMYEYPKVYEECTLRCQSCRRGFHAVVIRSPPLNGLDESFCSWGFLPLGFSSDSKDINGFGSNWNPFSPPFPCSSKGNTKKKKDWVYYDDEAAAAFINISDSSEHDSDGDWRGGKRRTSKRTRSSRRKFSDVRREPVQRSRKGSHAGAAGNENAGGGNGGSAGGGAVDGVAPVVPDGTNATSVISTRSEPGKRGAVGGPRKRGAGNLGKLDLNVEFSNDAEERQEPTRTGVREGHPTGHTEDNIEGIGFFEGLDEFLSSLPILNVVGDDKVKGH